MNTPEYLDLLLRFPDRETAIAAGVSRGATDDEAEMTAPLVGVLNICVIGEHSYNAGTVDAPEIVEVPGWWVLVRGPLDYPVPPEIAPLIATRDPLHPDPAVPDRVWA